MRRLLALIPLLAIAGCDSGPQSVEQIAAEVEETPRLKAGEWRTDFEITDFEVPGAPADMRASMQNMLQKQATTQCVSEQEAGQDPRDFLKKNQGTGCQFERFANSGGAIDAKLICAPEGGARSEATMKGTVAPERMTMTIATQTSIPGLPGGGAATINMKMNSVRTGDCA